MNAVAVTESDVNIKTPDGTRRLLLRAPGDRHGAGRAGLAGHLRAAAGVPPDGQAARRVRLFGAGGESVLSRQEGADRADSGAATPIPQLMPLAQALNETTHMTDAKAFIAWLDQQPSVAKNRKIGTQGYCMGGPMAFRTAAAVPDRVGAVASFHGGGLVTPNRRTARICRRRRPRRSSSSRSPRTTTSARPTRRRAEGDVRQGEPARGDRGLRGRRARLVPARFAASTTSRRPRRRGAACSRCTEKRWPEHRVRQPGPRRTRKHEEKHEEDFPSSCLFCDLRVFVVAFVLADLGRVALADQPEALRRFNVTRRRPGSCRRGDRHRDPRRGHIRRVLPRRSHAGSCATLLVHPQRRRRATAGRADADDCLDPSLGWQHRLRDEGEGPERPATGRTVRSRSSRRVRA